MRQTAEDASDAARFELVRVERLEAQVEALAERRVDLIDARRVGLARGDGDDRRLRVAQEDLDEFQGGVARASQDGDADHGQASRPVVDVPPSL